MAVWIGHPRDLDRIVVAEGPEKLYLAYESR